MPHHDKWCVWFLRVPIEMSEETSSVIVETPPKKKDRRIPKESTLCSRVNRSSLGRMPSREWKVAEVIPNTRQMMMSLITRKSAKMVAELCNGMALWIPDTTERQEDNSAVAKAITVTAVALDTKAFMVVAADLLSLRALNPPREFGSNAMMSWMQRFGAHIDTGGPAAVYLATSLKQVRRMPGRLIGESLDRLGNPVFRLNLQTQEQHTRDINKLLNDCDELLSKCLNFVKNVVDSEDLPLNVYRETLQQNKILLVIKKNHVTTCMDMFDEIAELNDDRKKFYEQCVECMKLGIREDSVDDFEIAELLRFFTSKPGG